MNTIVDAIAQVIRKHIPKEGIPIVGEYTWDGAYAQAVLSADLRATHNFGHSNDSGKLKELEASIRRSAFLLRDLEYITKKDIDNELAIFHRDSEEFTAFASLLFDLDVAMKSVAYLRKREVYSKSTNAKPNWRAISVAKTCRKIWAECEWRAKPETYGPAPLNALIAISLSNDEKKKWDDQRKKYQCFLETFAPRTQNHSRPGPFGRFLEDIFECLGIVAQDGAAVTAATALDALQKIERQE